MVDLEIEDLNRRFKKYEEVVNSDGRNGVRNSMDFLEGYVAGEKAGEERREEMQLKVLEAEALVSYERGKTFRMAEQLRVMREKVSNLLMQITDTIGNFHAE